MMIFDKEKLISFDKRDKAKIGKSYYCFDNIDTFIRYFDKDINYLDTSFRGVLRDINEKLSKFISNIEVSTNTEYWGDSTECYSKYLYPTYETDNGVRHLSLVDFRKRWIDNPTTQYIYHGGFSPFRGVLTYASNYSLTMESLDRTKEIDLYKSDVRFITDINNNPLWVENDGE